MTQARTLGLAAEMSFWLFLSLVPLAAVAGLAAARLASARGAWLARALASSVPPQARELVGQQVQRVAAWGSSVAPLGLATFFWLAASGVHAVFDALEIQSGTARPWWKKRVLALVTCIGLSIGVAALALLGMGLRWGEEFTGARLPDVVAIATHGVVARALRGVVAAVAAFAMVGGLYRIGIGRSAATRMGVMPGAAVAVVLMAGLGWGYGFYVGHVGTGDAYGAGLAVVGVTLMTLWLLSIALLVGVQFNRLVGRWRTLRSASRMRVEAKDDRASV